jgi:hypothetical protein
MNIMESVETQKNKKESVHVYVWASDKVIVVCVAVDGYYWTGAVSCCCCVSEFRNLCELLWEVWEDNRLCDHERSAHAST